MSNIGKANHNYAPGDRVIIQRSCAYSNATFQAGSTATVKERQAGRGGRPVMLAVRFDGQMLPGAVYLVEAAAVARAPSSPPVVHAIRGWDADHREEPICGEVGVSYMDKASGHEHATCPACRAHPDFYADRTADPWPWPETVPEATAMLERRLAWQAANPRPTSC